MYKVVLVPVDGSELSAFAVDLAAEVSRQTGASLELAHVHEPFVMAGGVPMVDTALDVENRGRIDGELERLRDRARMKSGKDATLTFLKGAVVPALHDYVKLARADLVVMTSRGRSGIGRALFGSVASALMQRLDVPVLFARPRTESQDSNSRFVASRILVPLDGSGAAEQVIEKTYDLTNPESTQYLLLRVLTPLPPPTEGSIATFTLGRDDLALRKKEAQRYLDEVADRIRARGITVNTIIAVNRDPARVILGMARTRKADVIAIATHGAGAFERMVLGSVADKIIRTAPIPTLAYRPSEYPTTDILTGPAPRQS